MDVEQVRKQLAQLPGWELKEQQAEAEPGGADFILQREFRFSDFAEAIHFVNRVAEVAQKLNHHPDLAVKYDRVTITLWSHDSRCVTERDLHLALHIQQLGDT